MGKMLLGGFAITLGLSGFMGGDESSSSANTAILASMQKAQHQKSLHRQVTLDDSEDTDAAAAANAQQRSVVEQTGIMGGLGTSAN